MGRLALHSGICLAGIGAALVFLSAPPASAQSSNRVLFTSDLPLKMEIRAPWRKLLREKEEKRWPATLVTTDVSGAPLSVELTVERRGISRQEVCDFPPIRLRFDGDSIRGTMFENEGSLKVVTHCDNGDRWTQYYVLEMLVYRIYNLITDYSFRVRPLRVRYRDVDRDREPDEEFAFVIEDIDQVADRHGLEELEPGRISPGRLDTKTASQLALFQLMIGNLDWSALAGPEGICCHNAKLIGSDEDADTVIPIPYDFDATGFVDAHYAVPPDRLGVRSVRTRLYRGYCAHNETLPAAREQILGLEREIKAIVRNEPRLKDRNRSQALDYLEDYFEILRSDEEFEKEVVSECRG